MVEDLHFDVKNRIKKNVEKNLIHLVLCGLRDSVGILKDTGILYISNILLQYMMF